MTKAAALLSASGTSSLTLHQAEYVLVNSGSKTFSSLCDTRDTSPKTTPPSSPAAPSKWVAGQKVVSYLRCHRGAFCRSYWTTQRQLCSEFHGTIRSQKAFFAERLHTSCCFAFSVVLQNLCWCVGCWACIRSNGFRWWLMVDGFQQDLSPG